MAKEAITQASDPTPPRMMFKGKTLTDVRKIPAAHSRVPIHLQVLIISSCSSSSRRSRPGGFVRTADASSCGCDGTCTAPTPNRSDPWTCRWSCSPCSSCPKSALSTSPSSSRTPGSRGASMRLPWFSFPYFSECEWLVRQDSNLRPPA